MSPNGSSLVLFDFSFAFNNIYSQTKPPPIKHKDIKDKLSNIEVASIAKMISDLNFEYKEDKANHTNYTRTNQ